MRALLVLTTVTLLGCSSLHVPKTVTSAPSNLRPLGIFMAGVDLRATGGFGLDMDKFDNALRDELVKDLRTAGYRVTTSAADPRDLMLRGSGTCWPGLGDQCELRLEAKTDWAQVDEVSAKFRVDDGVEDIAKYFADALGHSGKLAAFTPQRAQPAYGPGPGIYAPPPAQPGYPPAQPPPGSCGKDTDCPGNQVCAAGVCQEPPAR